MDAILNTIPEFAVVLARISAFVFIMPVFGNKTVPPQVKIGVSVFLSLFVLSGLRGRGVTLPTEFFPFMLVTMKEALTGLALGFITKFLFAGVQIAGDTVGRQMGFAMANVMDPAHQSQVSIVGEFQIFTVFLIYLAIDGHHFLLEGLMRSYDHVPVGAPIPADGVQMHVVRMAGGMFLTGVKISAPVVVSLLLTSIALGVLARTVPQMNIFIVGLPLRIGIGFIVLAMTLTLFFHIFSRLWGHFQQDFAGFLRVM